MLNWDFACFGALPTVSEREITVANTRVVTNCGEHSAETSDGDTFHPVARH